MSRLLCGDWDLGEVYFDIQGTANNFKLMETTETIRGDVEKWLQHGIENWWGYGWDMEIHFVEADDPDFLMYVAWYIVSQGFSFDLWYEP